MRYWDASAIVPLLVRQARTRDMERILEGDPAMVTWWGTSLECSSALMRLARKGSLGAEGVRHAEGRLHALREAWDEVLPGEAVRKEGFSLLPGA